MRRPLLALVVLSALLVPSAAEAFRPSVRWILLKAGEAQIKRKVQTLKLEQELTLYGQKEAPRGLRVEQETLVRTPFAMRQTQKRPEGTFVDLFTKDQVIKERPGKERSTKKAGANLFLHLAVGGAPATNERLADYAFRDMQAYGVDTGVVSYGRFDNRIAYIIGARSFEKDRSQVWIDKETLHLLRVIVVGKIAGKVTVFDTQYTGWNVADMRGLWPKTITRYQNGKLVNREVCTSLEKNTPVDRALFSN